MEVMAKHIRADMSAQKARLLADQIRGLKAEAAVELLRFSTKTAAKSVKKVVDSAIANAAENKGIDLDELFVKKVFVDEGPVMKRFHARARGRSAGVKKFFSNLTIVVKERAE